MTTLPLRRTARAEQDLIEIWSHVARDDPRAADRLLDSFEARWMLLVEQPYSGVARDDIAAGIRHVVTGQYLTLYRVTEVVEIVRVLHGRRNLADSV